MATKMCFLSNNKSAFEEKIVEFTYVKGLAFSQKQKNVLSFHSSIRELYPNAKILEVSTKSHSNIGVDLSAFNLKLDGVPIENIFQASKVFENGEQFDFLISYHPREAKQFVAKEGLKLKSFKYKGMEIPLNPPSMFYDYIYCTALSKIPHISKELAYYDIFTDIEFNEKKQINCQARACAIYSYMLKTNTVDYYLSFIKRFEEIYGFNFKEEQLSFF